MKSLPLDNDLKNQNDNEEPGFISFESQSLNRYLTKLRCPLLKQSEDQNCGRLGIGAAKSTVVLRCQGSDPIQGPSTWSLIDKEIETRKEGPTNDNA
jgi:hypothetical protein